MSYSCAGESGDPGAPKIEVWIFVNMKKQGNGYENILCLYLFYEIGGSDEMLKPDFKIGDYEEE